ncbi:MAG TPA: endo-1,4-beta-xylanase [Opitutaceae bacterium]|jgi:endo-1,4-beta-xylanase
MTNRRRIFSIIGCLFWFQIGAAAQSSLKDVAHGLFYIGVAINSDQFLGRDATAADLIGEQFNSISPENALKWEHVHPQADRYDFADADRYVQFGAERGMFVVGHTLMWHSQTPRWLFQAAGGGEVGKAELLQRLRDHIRTVVGRYRGRVKGWDVVNEAIADKDGKLRTDKPWYRILGEEGVFEAFRTAHEADPAAELYYNDYSLENPIKRAGVIRLVQKIRARGLRIDAVGSQEHDSLDRPSLDQMDAAFTDFAKAGIKIQITELDVTVLPRPGRYSGADVAMRSESAPALDPYRQGLSRDKELELARRYGAIFALYVRHHENIKRVTFWGLTDRNSWLNGWPVRGRTDYPLLFDRTYQPKPAFGAVMAALRTGSDAEMK